MKSETHRRKKKEMKVAVAMGGSEATSSPCGARCAHHEEKTRRTLEKSLTSAHPVATSLRVDWGWASGGWRAEPTPTSTLHKRKHFTTGVFRTEFNERGRGNGEGPKRGKQKPVWEIVRMRSGVNAYQKKKKATWRLGVTPVVMEPAGSYRPTVRSSVSIPPSFTNLLLQHMPHGLPELCQGCGCTSHGRGKGGESVGGTVGVTRHLKAKGHVHFLALSLSHTLLISVSLQVLLIVCL